jgi:hypothetical protein
MTKEQTAMAENSGERIRAGDADRERVVEQLREHHEVGRLDLEEFNERMESALLARYLDELPPLLADLPRPASAQAEQDSGERPSGGWPPPWPRGWGRPRRGPLPWPAFVPLLAALVVFAVIGSVAAVAHGHFPFPLLWLFFALLWFKPWARRRWYGWYGSYGGRDWTRHEHYPSGPSTRSR